MIMINPENFEGAHSEYSSAEKQKMFELAESAISHYLKTRHPLELSATGFSKNLQTEGASFVTLTINGNLRGCVGSLWAYRPLYEDIINNATAAAFKDDRFIPLTKGENQKIDIEISLLSQPKKVDYKNIQEMLSKIGANTDGVTIMKDKKVATFLPQVWSEVPDKEEFLSELCFKAGLSNDEWKNGSLEVFTYQVQIIPQSFRIKRVSYATK